jgi:hypothetical protein
MADGGERFVGCVEVVRRTLGYAAAAKTSQ